MPAPASCRKNNEDTPPAQGRSVLPGGFENRQEQPEGDFLFANSGGRESSSGENVPAAPDRVRLLAEKSSCY
jgi:hypothetical protein